MSDPGPRFFRLFKYRVLPGMEQTYRDYLRDIVDAIDAKAHLADAFVSVATITPVTQSEWTHDEWTMGRLFGFRDAVQRDGLPAAMAKASLAFDGSEAARDARKAHAETLRQAVAICDYDLS